MSQKEREIERIQAEVFGPSFRGATLSDVIFESKYQEAVSAWMNSRNNFLVIIGEPGTGKTHLCAALFAWFHDKVETWRYWKEKTLFSKLRASFEQLSGDYLTELHNAIDDDLVIIDDLGASGITEWRSEIAFEVIDYRYTCEKPTIITSNLTKAEFQNYIGKRGTSRLFAKRNTIIGYLQDYDLRQTDIPKANKDAADFSRFSP